MADDNKTGGAFWTSLPGILAGLATLVSAVVPGIVALNKPSHPAPVIPATASASGLEASKPPPPSTVEQPGTLPKQPDPKEPNRQTVGEFFEPELVKSHNPNSKKMEPAQEAATAAAQAAADATSAAATTGH